MAATWLALKSFGSAPDIRTKALAATKAMALAQPHPAAADVLVGVKPSPITEPSTAPPLPAAAGSVAPPPLATAPEIAPLPPDTATPRVARLPPVAPELVSAPLGAATPSSVPPPTSEVASLPPNAVTPDAVPLPPRRPAGLAESLPVPPAEAARAAAGELSPPTVARGI